MRAVGRGHSPTDMTLLIYEMPKGQVQEMTRICKVPTCILKELWNGIISYRRTSTGNSDLAVMETVKQTQIDSFLCFYFVLLFSGSIPSYKNTKKGR